MRYRMNIEKLAYRFVAAVNTDIIYLMWIWFVIWFVWYPQEKRLPSIKCQRDVHRSVLQARTPYIYFFISSFLIATNINWMHLFIHENKNNSNRLCCIFSLALFLWSIEDQWDQVWAWFLNMNFVLNAGTNKCECDIILLVYAACIIYLRGLT